MDFAEEHPSGLDMALMYQRMHATLAAIMECAVANIIFPPVSRSYIKAQEVVPTPEQLLDQSIKANCALTRAAGDIIKLRALEERYKHLF